MAVITMLLTAPQLKLEQAGRRAAQRKSKTPKRPQSPSSLLLHWHKTLHEQVCLPFNQGFLVLVPTEQMHGRPVRLAVVV